MSRSRPLPLSRHFSHQIVGYSHSKSHSGAGARGQEEEEVLARLTFGAPLPTVGPTVSEEWGYRDRTEELPLVLGMSYKHGV